jgi:hypothetical protein
MEMKFIDRREWKNVLEAIRVETGLYKLLMAVIFIV